MKTLFLKVLSLNIQTNNKALLSNKIQLQMMNKLLIVALILLPQWIFSQDRLSIDRVVAKVGSEIILLSEVESQYQFTKTQDPSGQFGRCEILESMIGQKLIVHQAKLDSVIVSDAEVDAQIDFRISSVLRQMNGDEERFEEYYQMSIDEMRTSLRDDMISQILAEKMQQQILTEVEITPKEVTAFYESIPKDSLPYLNAEVEIAEIVAAPEVNEIERLKALQEILEIRKKIVDGEEDFATLAKKHSDDPGSGAQGGELGYAERGNYVPEFEAEAYQLEIDELSEPVETQYGFHIIQLIERRGNKIKLRHILITPDITYDDMDLAKAGLDSLKANIENEEIDWGKAVSKHSLETAQSYNNGGRMQNPNTGKTFFQTSELPPEIYFAIEEMEVGEISIPLEYMTPRGETEYRIIKLLTRSKPHQVSLEEDYSKIQQLAKENKKNKYFTDWITEKLDETFIKLDGAYLECPSIEKYLR